MNILYKSIMYLRDTNIIYAVCFLENTTVWSVVRYRLKLT